MILPSKTQITLVLYLFTLFPIWAEDDNKEEEISGVKEISKAEVVSDQPPPRKIYGWKEWVRVGESRMVLRAKLDTGARTCSIHAEKQKIFELDGKKWVKFMAGDPRRPKSPRTEIRAQLRRVAVVKNDDGKVESRYVVALPIEIDGRKLEVEFTLNDRRGMICAVLLGRNALNHLGLIDSGKTYTLSKKKKKRVPAHIIIDEDKGEEDGEIPVKSKKKKTQS